ncbi:NUDIX domain-containing protein [Candidatus Falkowbacteria bacterium]|nr:NUDIX domain-containing protein [Candidatus Falkowbacteria bacterium]
MNKIIIASGPVIVEKGKVLLNKHGDTPFWKFCGGSVENFEMDLQETAKKEAKSEMGLEIEITDPEPFIVHTKKDDVDVILVHYNAKRTNDEIKPREDIREWKWMPLKDLEKEDLAPNIEPALVHFWYLDK